MKLGASIILVTLLRASCQEDVSPFTFTAPTPYKQCDLSWGNDHYGPSEVNTFTICNSGDQLTSLSMILDGC